MKYLKSACDTDCLRNLYDKCLGQIRNLELCVKSDAYNPNAVRCILCPSITEVTAPRLGIKI